MEEASRRSASALIGDRARRGSRGTTRVSNSRVLCSAVEKEKQQQQQKKKKEKEKLLDSVGRSTHDPALA